MSHSLLKLTFLLATATIVSSIIGIPFKENHLSHFIYKLNQFNGERYLDCTGNFTVVQDNSEVIFTFYGVRINNIINIPQYWVEQVLSKPIQLKLVNGTLLDPESVKHRWMPVDPRIIVKIFRYVNIPDDGKLLERGWELDDLNCVPKAVTEDSPETVKLVLHYNLDDCTEEKNIDHSRVVGMVFDKEKKYLTKIEYHYRRMDDYGSIYENLATIDFVGFV